MNKITLKLALLVLTCSALLFSACGQLADDEDKDVEGPAAKKQRVQFLKKQDQ